VRKIKRYRGFRVDGAKGWAKKELAGCRRRAGKNEIRRALNDR
jgi:hypothetical protein